MQLQIDIIQKRAHQSAQEVAIKSYLQAYIDEYRRVFEAEVDRLDTLAYADLTTQY